jgi:hypothetical protein
VDENFRVLTDISLKLTKLEEDVRVSRQTNETEIPVPSPITPRETRLTDHYQQIKLKDAIVSVPVFDGYRPSVFQFLRSCERARSIIPRHREPQLVKLLMNKLRGHAFLAVEDSGVVTLNDFGNKLTDMFGRGKTVNEYRGELETVFQRPGENILDYVDSVRNLRLAIIDSERCEYGSISRNVQDTIDWDTKEDSVKGLPNEVYLPVKVSGYQSLEDAYRQAVKATRELKQINDRMRYQRPTSSSNNNRNNVRPPNNNYTGNNRNNVNPSNNNYTGNNHNDRRSVPPSQSRPNC